MGTYQVLPRVGIGPVRLGMHRDEVRRAMGEVPETFRKTEDSRYETDCFHNCGFQVFYGGGEPRVVFIELSRDCGFVTLYRSKDVFSIEASDLIEFVAQDAQFDDQDPELGYSYTFPTLELSLWRPVLPQDKDDPEGAFFSTIGVGIEGYFSQERQR
jgi:hypothetical protein